MLLGITEFTKVYLLVKDNPIQFVNLFKLSQNLGMGDGEVAESLRSQTDIFPELDLNMIESRMN